MNIQSALRLHIGDSVQCNDGLIGTVVSTPRKAQVRENGMLYDYIDIDIHTPVGNETVYNVLIENNM